MEEYYSQSVDLFVNTTVADWVTSVQLEFAIKVLLGDWTETAFRPINYRALAAEGLAIRGLPLNRVLAPIVGGALRLKDALFVRIPASSELVDVHEPDRFDERFDDLWTEIVSANPNTLLAERSSETLNWHYSIPAGRGDLRIFAASRAGSLRAFCVLLRHHGQRGFETMRLVDFQSAEPDSDLLSPLLRAATRRCKAEKVHALWQIGSGVPKMQRFDRIAPYRHRRNWRFFYQTSNPELAVDLRSVRGMGSVGVRRRRQLRMTEPVPRLPRTLRSTPIERNRSHRELRARPPDHPAGETGLGGHLEARMPTTSPTSDVIGTACASCPARSTARCSLASPLSSTNIARFARHRAGARPRSGILPGVWQPPEPAPATRAAQSCPLPRSLRPHGSPGLTVSNCGRNTAAPSSDSRGGTCRSLTSGETLSTSTGLLANPALRPLRRGLARVLYARYYDRRHLYELWERQHLAKVFRHCHVDCVFDVGANRGQYATMLRKLGYRGLIVSFEPIPMVAAQLRHAAASDRLWLVEEIAIADHDGDQTFNVMAGDEFSSLSSASTADTGRVQDQNMPLQAVQVRTETLGTVYRRLHAERRFERPFLKLDSQGYDVKIVQAGRDVLPHFVGFQSELAVKRLYADSVDFREAITIYQEFGFELSAFVPNNAGHFPLLLEADCIMLRRDLTEELES